MAFAPPPAPGTRLSRRDVAQILLLTGAIALIYGAAAQFSLRFASLPSYVAAVWFPSALTLPLVLGLGIRAIPGIFLGSILGLLGVLTNQGPSPLAAFVLNITCAVANIVQPWLAWKIIATQIPIPTLFTSLKSGLVFIQAAIISPASSAFLGVTIHCIVGVIPWADYGSAWTAWWLASALAHLIFSPPLLLWRDVLERDRHQPLSRASHGIFLVFLLTVALSFRFGYRAGYVLLPTFLCIAVSHGRFFSSVLVAFISLFAILVTTHQDFALLEGSMNENLLFLQVFMSSISITSLTLSLSIYDRQQSQTALQDALRQLEDRVSERTAELKNSQAQLTGFFSSSPIGMGIVDREFRLIQFNDVLLQILQIQISPQAPMEYLSGLEHNLGILVTHISQVMGTGEPLLNQEFRNCLKSGGPDPKKSSLIGEFYQLRKKGERTWILSYFPIFNGAGMLHQVGFMVIDISERKRLECQLQRQACQDGLTKLANRRFFDQAFEEEWRRAIAEQHPLGLLICDADHFKSYNDTYGHQAGDRCLIQVAQILQRHGRSGIDLAARYGGEEFVLLLPNLSAREVLAVADRLCGAIRQRNLPHRGSRVSDRVTLSIGVVVAVPQGADGAAAFLQGADRALYEAKRQGRDRVVQLPFPATATSPCDVPATDWPEP
jgi:diguanylate cyclase (GGDEF)-like protein